MRRPDRLESPRPEACAPTPGIPSDPDGPDRTTNSSGATHCLSCLFVICCHGTLRRHGRAAALGGARRLPGGRRRTIPLDTDSTNPNGSGQPVDERRDAIRRRSGAGYSFGVYVDGNGDGVRTPDITMSIDRPLGAVERLPDNFAGVDFGLLPGLPPVDAGSPAPGTDPIKLGASNLLSYSATGTSSSGSLYIRGRQQVSIRDSRPRRHRANPRPEVRSARRDSGNLYDAAATPIVGIFRRAAAASTGSFPRACVPVTSSS